MREDPETRLKRGERVSPAVVPRSHVPARQPIAPLSSGRLVFFPSNDLR